MDERAAVRPLRAVEGATRPEAEGLSVVLPAYAEERAIASVLRALCAELEPLRGRSPLEIIVVDDGSRDATAAQVRGIDDATIRLVTHPENRGYGAALKTGTRTARYPWIVILDADGTYPPSAIPTLLAALDGHDMVVGARTSAICHVPLVRRPAKWALRKLASWLSGRSIPDLNSGLRIVRREVIERFVRLLPDGFSFATTITLATLSAGYRVKFVPIDYLRREGRSKIRPIADTLGFLKLIVRTVLFFDPLRIFVPAALAFFLAAAAGLAASLVGRSLLSGEGTLLLFVTGVQLLALGAFADSINRRL